jgi:hypothetical protein
MSDWGVNLIRTMNMDPTFKGGMVVIVSALALLFAFWMKKRWREPLKGAFLLFISLAVFCFLFGLSVMIIQPQWWKLPY